ncbi:Oligoxyloglucan reducing end-specific cellobiohydrolase [Mycena alexandri]|uniref:Oligoxyloglucan reducing end-specific cellobiohydrolase n=1 Tax=Mycena alexandri TaxID=1745969 RepID=A0AAD6X8C1_9AGAR|nr:Oligoxyloglucan reducing end-specific cellobiohydrolase [Mycena alexandri]
MHLNTLFFLVFVCSLVLGQSPEHAVTSLGRNLPTNLFFFRNSPSVVYYSIPERSLYVSHDTGRSWARETRIPVGIVDDVILHPAHSRVAFVITNAQTHFRTQDGGHTWLPLELPPDPAPRVKALSFHSDPRKSGYILYQSEVCDTSTKERVCHGETYVTTDAFKSPPRRIPLTNTAQCQFAPAKFQSEAVYCIVRDGNRFDSGAHLYSSTDFFESDKKLEEACAGKGKNAKGFVPSPTTGTVFASTATLNFAVLALEAAGEMTLCVSKDLKTWVRVEIPMPLRENSQYHLLPAGDGLGIDVLTSADHAIGTLFVSDAEGTRFVESLRDTNWRRARGESTTSTTNNGVLELDPDWEAIADVPGVAIRTVVANAAEVVGRGVEKLLRTLITYDGGRSWAPIRASGNLCPTDTANSCSLHLHPRPRRRARTTSLTLHWAHGSAGVVVGVGRALRADASAGKTNAGVGDEVFMSTDAGGTWVKLSTGAALHEFADAGSILVMLDVGVDNEHYPVHELRYSIDLGASWQTYDFEEPVAPLDFIPIPGPRPDAGAWTFILLAERSSVVSPDDRYVLIHLDFAGVRKAKCTSSDFEMWQATPPGAASGCLMGSKQTFKRRKVHADCYVGDNPTGTHGSAGNCPCADADYECDYNFAWDDHACVAIAPPAIPPGVCLSMEDTYLSSSGYRKIPGNSCVGGSKDEKVQKSCQPEKPAEGAIAHQTFEFPSRIIEHQYFADSTTLLVLLVDHTLWQSNDEGYSWMQLSPGEHFVSFYIHKFDARRAYLLTNTEKFFYTVNGGRMWFTRNAPTPPTSFHALALRFHPDPDKLLWIGDRDCQDWSACHAEAQYSLDNGATWAFVEGYVVNCAWAVGTKLAADETEILCESYRDKTGSQMLFQMGMNPLALVEGARYFKEQKKIFDEVVGFTKFSEFLVVAELLTESRALNLQVSLDGVHFAAGRFPPNMDPNAHTYTILDSSTASLFVHMTMSEAPHPYWGNVLKSNSNGTYFSLSVEHVNRDARGYVDFEKMAGLDGIALINVVSNPDEAVITGHKVLQSRITYNDGGTWKPLDPPTHDSHGNRYSCTSTRCALHVHGYTERFDPAASYSSSSVVGLLMAVGTVGESLVSYDQSDTFLSRDGGFTWEEVHKDAHLWKVGDSGSIIVIANDEQPTDHILFTTNEGIDWHEYKFSKEKVRVRSIVTVPADTSRRFLLLAHPSRASSHLAVSIDFTALTSRQCVTNVQDLDDDDFELWSPSSERAQRCLFGRQTFYHRRIREAECYVGKLTKGELPLEKNCTCVKADFECEFNYYKNDKDDCVLAPGTSPLPPEATCVADGFWYERTPYRKIAFSSCVDGERLDRGPKHPCQPSGGRGLPWIVILVSLCLALAGYWYYRADAGTGARLSEHLQSLWGRIYSRRERRGYESVPLNETSF